MIIIEGIDGVGKTTTADFFKENGMIKYHFDYDSKNMNLKDKYLKVLKVNEKLILDRSFISEMVYGTVIRKYCRLSISEYNELIMEYSKKNYKIIYLKASKEILLNRRFDSEDLSILNLYYELLEENYTKFIDIASNYLEVFKYDTGENNKEQIRKLVMKL